MATVAKQFRILRIQRSNRGYKSASQKLFEDAEREENDQSVDMQRERLEARLKSNENWTGDESIQDAVLRMLVDKYKPHRSGSIKTAEQKLKANPPSIAGSSYTTQHNQDVSEPILQGIEGHKPWMTTYRTPSFAVTPSVRAMRPPPPSKNRRDAIDDSVPVKGPTREDRIRIATANKLGAARERSFEYRFGVPSSSRGGSANPVSLKGWVSLVEDRIEVTLAGLPLSSLTQR